MELSAWLSLASICILGAMSPGPSLAVVLKNTVSGGRLNGIVTSVSHGIGIGIYALLTVGGLAVLIRNTPWLFNLIQYAGVVFLLWMAYKALTSKPESTQFELETCTVTFTQSFLQGISIALLNPKILVFFLALFGQFVSITGSWFHNLIMVVTIVSIDIIWYCIIAIAFSESNMLVKLRENSHIVNKVTGVLLLLVAARLNF